MVSREERVARLLHYMDDTRKPWDEIGDEERGRYLADTTTICAGVDALLEGPIRALGDAIASAITDGAAP